MTLIKKHVCTRCGGALTIHKDRQQYECPYCSIFFDYEYFRSRDILEQAASSQKMLQFDSAMEKYNFILNKEPHDFLAIRGKLLCEAKINRADELKKPEKILSISKEAVMEAEEEVESEGKAYFALLLRLQEIAIFIRANDQERSQLEEGRRPDPENPGLSIRIDGVEKSHLLAANREKRKKFDENFASIYSRLELLDPLEQLFPEDNGGLSKEEERAMENLLSSRSCTSCGGELIVNMNLQIFECPFCGMSFDFDFIRDETAGKEAEESLKQSQYIKADGIFAYILKSDPKNFDALRGRILCSAKWPDIPKDLVSEAMQRVHVPTLQKRAEEAVSACEEKNRPYFELFLKIIPEYECFITAISPANHSRRSDRQLLDEKAEQKENYIKLEREYKEYLDRASAKEHGPDLYDMAVLSNIRKKMKEVRRNMEAIDKVRAKIGIDISDLSQEGRKAMSNVENLLYRIREWEMERKNNEGTAD